MSVTIYKKKKNPLYIWSRLGALSVHPVQLYCVRPMCSLVRAHIGFDHGSALSFYIYLGCGWTPATTSLTILSLEWFQYNTHLSNLQSYVYYEISTHIYVQTILLTEWGLPSILFNKTHNGPQHIKRPQKFCKRRGHPYKYVSCTMGQCLKHS